MAKREYTEEEKARFAKTGRKSSRKGKAYERDVYKIANPYIECLGWAWSRTPQSGGSVRASRYAHLRSERADLRVDADCPIFPECKDRKNWSLDQLIKGGLDNWLPTKWYVEAFEKASHAAKAPVLIFKRNQSPSFAMLAVKDYLEVTSADLEESKLLRFGDFVMLLFTDFMEVFVKRQKEDRGL